jgi:hypothetical protein
MGKGGGGGEQTSTVYQSSLPQYAEPYYKSLMNRSLAESKRPYQPYRGQRLAGASLDTRHGLSMATNFSNSGLGALPGAQSLTANAANKAAGMTNYQSGFDAGQFGQSEADQYMSPYMDAVTDRSKIAATKDAMQEQLYRDSEAAKTGAFGGSRAAVQKQMATGDLMNRLVDIDVGGRQSAFENAQQQFERDRAARAQQEQFSQGAVGLNQQGVGLQGQMAGQMADLQKLNDQMTLQRIQARLGVGQTREDYKQEQLDTAYNDFINQRDAQRQNLQFYSSLLQGVPVSANQNVTQTTPTNPLAGAAGTLTGLQALYALQKT